MFLSTDVDRSCCSSLEDHLRHSLANSSNFLQEGYAMMMHKLALPALAALILTLPVKAKSQTAAEAEGGSSSVVSLDGSGLKGHGNFQSNTRLAFVNGLLGSNKVDLYLDGKSLYRNVREERPMKPKAVRAEGYSVQVNAAKIGLNYLDFTKDLLAGHDYTLVATGNLDNGGAAGAVLVDVPNVVIGKFATNVVFVNGSPDLTSATLLIDGQVVAADVLAGQYSQPVTIGAAKHIVEVQANGGGSLVKPFKVKTKGATALTFVLTGTVATDDRYGLRLEQIVAKGPK
jgi:hypothetical protein